MLDKFSNYLSKFPSHEKYGEWLCVPPDASEAIVEFPELEGSEIVKHEREVICDGVSRLAFYMILRWEDKHMSHAFAEMLAMQQPAGGMTDDVFFSGMGMLGDGMRPQQLESLIAESKRQGFTPTGHEAYIPGLARWRGDREAYVSRAQGRSYIKSLIEKRGWDCDGAVNVKGRGPERDPFENAKPLGEDIIRDTARDMIKSDPSLAKLPRKELRERIINKHGFKAGKT